MKIIVFKNSKIIPTIKHGQLASINQYNSSLKMNNYNTTRSIYTNFNKIQQPKLSDNNHDDNDNVNNNKETPIITDILIATLLSCAFMFALFAPLYTI
jgi:hypothetical protein